MQKLLRFYRALLNERDDKPISKQIFQTRGATLHYIGWECGADGVDPAFDRQGLLRFCMRLWSTVP